MRKARVFSHEVVMPRMSWSPKNLYNFIARSTVPFHARQTSFKQTSMTMYQQRWRSKRFLRAYHGDWIPEKRFKRWFLPSDLPRFFPPQRSFRRGAPEASERMPTASLFMREVERRLDVVVFRCCFARSAYEARSLVVQGKVKLNGQKMSDPNTLLNPGDLISVEPEAIPMLSEELAKRFTKAKVDEVVDAEATEVEGEAEAAEASEPAAKASEQPASSDKGKGKEKVLPPGVRPFHLPPYAAPFLFIPPYIEPSFATCSAIYIRHPTITTHKDGHRTDLPSPYPAGGELYSMAWEHYTRNSPRVRGQARRTKLAGRYSPDGFEKSCARDLDTKRVALRRGWGRTKEVRGWRSKLNTAKVAAARAAA